MFFLFSGMTKSNYYKNDIKYVYVCGKSKIYHKSNTHSSFKRCKSNVRKITESQAKKEGKRVCKCKK